MEIFDIIAKAEASTEFAEWRKGDGASELVHVFCMTGQPAQIGYFDNKGKEMVTFDISDDNKVVFNKAGEVFTQNGSIKSIDRENIKIDKPEALSKAMGLLKEKYPKEDSQKTIFVLQNLPEGQAYNITFFTRSFKTINFKLDTATGDLISESADSLISFG